MSLPLPCSHAERVMALANRQGVLRPVDLAPLGIQAEVLRRLLARGLIKKIGRGRYVPAGMRLDPPLVWAGVARAVPNGVLCLRSALTLHKVMSMPLEPVDLAIERRDGGRWVRVHDDGDWSTMIVFEGLLTVTNAVITWDIPPRTPAGVREAVRVASSRLTILSSREWYAMKTARPPNRRRSR